MLFVDDDEAEPGKENVLAEQGVRADDHVGKPHLEFAQNHLAFCGGRGADQQSHVQARGVEERLQ